MKLGKLPPVPYENDLRGWCAFDALEKDDYFPMIGYSGSCPNCSILKVPNEFWVVYVKTDGQWHVFKTMEDVFCEGCQIRVEYVSVLCQSIVVDVTVEFEETRK